MSIPAIEKAVAGNRAKAKLFNDFATTVETKFNSAQVDDTDVSTTANIQGTKLLDNSLPGAKLQDGTVGNLKIQGDAAVDANRAIANNQIKTDAVDARTIAAGAVGTSELADASVGTAKVVAASLGTDKLKFTEQLVAFSLSILTPLTRAFVDVTPPVPIVIANSDIFAVLPDTLVYSSQAGPITVEIRSSAGNYIARVSGFTFSGTGSVSGNLLFVSVART